MQKALSDVERIPADEIARRRAQFDEVKRIAKARRDAAAGGKTVQTDAAE